MKTCVPFQKATAFQGMVWIIVISALWFLILASVAPEAGPSPRGPELTDLFTERVSTLSAQEIQDEHVKFITLANVHTDIDALTVLAGWFVNACDDETIQGVRLTMATPSEEWLGLTSLFGKPVPTLTVQEIRGALEEFIKLGTAQRDTDAVARAADWLVRACDENAILQFQHWIGTAQSLLAREPPTSGK